MTKWTYDNAKLKAARPFHGPEYEELVERAKACMLFRMSPEYFDAMTQMEYAAWVAAFNEINKETGGQQ